MKKKEIAEGFVERVDYPNRGVVRVGDETVSVKNVVPGQTVRFRVIKARRGSAVGRFLDVTETSALETRKRVCGIFPLCGGCLYQTVPYEEQLKIKEEQLMRLLKPFLEPDTVCDGIKRSPSEWAYRNKMEFSFGNAVKDGPLTLGLHRKGSTYDVLTADTCRLVHEDMRRIVSTTLRYCTERGFTPYNKIRHDGYMRYLLIRRAEKTGEILVCLVTSTEQNHDFVEWRDQILALDLEGTPVGVMHATCDDFADDVRADKIDLLYGRDWMEEELLGLRFKISLFSFFQTNSAGAEVLYQTVRDYVGDEPGQVLYDLYCGTGTIAQLMADRAERVYGIELIEEAVEAAKENAERNGITNCRFVCGDVLKKLEELEEKPDYIILDPPREGVVPKSLSQIIAYGVPKMVYVSCKASSLTRDLVELRSAGYKVERVAFVDMFPQTQHVETVVHLSKGNISSQNVRVEFSLEDMDMSRFQQGATYEQIQAWVQEKYGFHVTHLNIAKTKRKCGIIERENHNHPKSEDSRSPKTPKEKEEAIMEAFKHFQMI